MFLIKNRVWCLFLEGYFLTLQFVCRIFNVLTYFVHFHLISHVFPQRNWYVSHIYKIRWTIHVCPHVWLETYGGVHSNGPIRFVPVSRPNAATPDFVFFNSSCFTHMQTLWKYSQTKSRSSYLNMQISCVSLHKCFQLPSSNDNQKKNSN